MGGNRTFAALSTDVCFADRTDLGSFSANGRFFYVAIAAKRCIGGLRTFAVGAAALLQQLSGADLAADA